ncbi:MAG: aldo/keto reductase [Propioniciclava sp.]|uniref:aldo/keto reductase n=1 Tax=Propioniciclava sp. TaxID=2038686 RepID=UPI0039E2C654
MGVSTALPTFRLPGVDTPLTSVVMGTMSMGDTADAAASEALLEAAIEAGITGIDCANGYARGTTEALIAPFVARHRDEIVLATKAGMPHPDAGEHAPLSSAGLTACVEGSLRRLGVETIDLFYLHQPDRRTPIAETMQTIAALHQAGKIRALGVSNYAAWQTLDVIQAAREIGTLVPVVGQNVYNLLARRIEDEWVEFAATHDVITMCYNPLAGGLLVRVPDEAATPARFAEGSSLAEMYKKRYWTPELLAAVAQIGEIAAQAGLSMPELGMRWLLSQPGANAVLVGGDQVEHLHANLASLAQGPLPADVLDACQRISEPLKGVMPAYNR